MFSLLISLAVLIVGYLVYGRITERVFAPDDRQTPAVAINDGVWSVKKAECQGIDAFELWCWRRLLKFPWTARRSNQSIFREINPEYSLEGLML